jgi:PAS domain S-box-containing protein
MRREYSQEEEHRREPSAPRPSEGEVHGVREFARLLRTEERLRESEETYRALVDCMPDIVTRLDPEGRFLFASRNILETTGIPAEQYVGRTSRELGFPESLCRIWDQALREALDRNAPFETEFSYLGPQGERLFNLRVLPERDEEGRVRSVCCLNRDITAQRRAEQDYRTLFREMPDGFALHEIERDTEGRPRDYRFLAVNPAFERMTGLRAEEVLGRTARELHPDADPSRIERLLQVALTGEPLLYEEHVERLGRDFSVSAFRPAPERFACFLVDITERKRAEEERERLRTQFLQAQKMESVGRLAGGVAHDFNNMLGVILGYAELSMGGLGPDHPLRGNLAEIRKAAEHASALTRQLLAFARQQPSTPRVLDLNETVEGMLRMLRRLIGEDVDLRWRPGRDLGPVEMDPGQIEQILTNLCVNARDALPNRGRIEVETEALLLDEALCAGREDRSPGPYLRLSVRDNGCGMDEGTLSRIFEPFFTTKEPGRGTGLGLSTVYGIVRQNGGFLDVSSEPGRGTTVRVYLPRYGGTAEPQERSSSSSAPAPTRSRRTVLLVEDEPAILRMVSEMLRRLGFDVLAAGTPAEALRLGETHPGAIHMVLTDVVMPEMNGRELADALASLHPDIKRMFMSGYPADILDSKGLQEGEVPFLQKPFALEELAATLEALKEEPPRPGRSRDETP